MQHRGLNTGDPKLVRLMQQRVVACLGHWKRRGYLASTPANDLKGALLWRLADKPVTDASYDPHAMWDRPSLPLVGR
jgi:hypothetical protein